MIMLCFKKKITALIKHYWTLLSYVHHGFFKKNLFNWKLQDCLSQILIMFPSPKIQNLRRQMSLGGLVNWTMVQWWYCIVQWWYCIVQRWYCNMSQVLNIAIYHINIYMQFEPFEFWGFSFSLSQGTAGSWRPSPLSRWTKMWWPGWSPAARISNLAMPESSTFRYSYKPISFWSSKYFVYDNTGVFFSTVNVFKTSHNVWPRCPLVFKEKVVGWNLRLNEQRNVLLSMPAFDLIL